MFFFYLIRCYIHFLRQPYFSQAKHSRSITGCQCITNFLYIVSRASTLDPYDVSYGHYDLRIVLCTCTTLTVLLQDLSFDSLL